MLKYLLLFLVFFTIGSIWDMYSKDNKSKKDAKELEESKNQEPELTAKQRFIEEAREPLKTRLSESIRPFANYDDDDDYDFYDDDDDDYDYDDYDDYDEEDYQSERFPGHRTWNLPIVGLPYDNNLSNLLEAGLGHYWLKPCSFKGEPAVKVVVPGTGAQAGWIPAEHAQEITDKLHRDEITSVLLEELVQYTDDSWSARITLVLKNFRNTRL